MNRILIVMLSVSSLAAACSGSHSPSSPSTIPSSPSGFGSPSGAVMTPGSVDWNCLTSGCASTMGVNTLVAAAATAPGAPAGFSVTASGPTVTLLWSAPASGDAPTSYVVEAGSVAGASDLASFDTGNAATSLIVMNVPAATYYVRLRAKNGAGTSAPSIERTLVVAGGPTACTAAPAAPAGLTSSVNGSTVQLSWSAASGASSYILEAGASSGSSALANSDVGAVTSYTATGVGSGTYYIRLRAKNSCGTSAASTEITATVGSSTPTPTPSPSGVPSWFSAFGNGVQISLSGTSVVLQTMDLPDHRSPYWGVGNALYESPHAGMMINPALIASQNITISVPVSPSVGAASDTPLGPVGIAVNGVVFFNQYAAGRQPLTTEILSFDRYGGHPQQQGQYHYHVEPTWLTAVSKSRLLGVLADGFPVYGTTESTGAAPAGLDTCHGHIGATPEFPSGIYHYHVTADAPYISGCFRGAPGRIG